MITDQELKKIRQEAEAYSEKRFPVGTKTKSLHHKTTSMYGYEAGATVERERAKVLVDAAKDVCEKLEPLLPESILSSIYNTLSNALKQYNP